jgi:signal transduction histidine kinase
MISHTPAAQTSNTIAIDEFSVESGSVPGSTWREMGSSEHFVQFYDTDMFLMDAVGDFISCGLRAGEAGIIVSTPAHQRGIEARLRADGIDVSAAVAAGRYLSLDATHTLSLFMVDGMPDTGKFFQLFGGVLDGATRNNRPVRVFGEMVSLLARDGNNAATIRLEELWNELGETRSFSLFCAYAMDQFDGKAQAHLLSHVCEQHSSVIPSESYSALPDKDARLRAISALQQKASWLEEEIAERKRAEERLRIALESERAAREETEAALRLRDQFLSIAAHELKTPLTALSGHAQLAVRKLRRGGDLDPEQILVGIETVSSQADKLSRLLDQLLDISRLDAGKLPLHHQEVDLVTTVQEVVSNSRVLNHGHPIILSAPESLAVRADPLRIEQVLANLLNNAAKYSPIGSTIDVTLSSTGDTAIELSVRDRGFGIPDEKRGHIFERFYQAPSNGYATGLGLGLYISRQIVELHGGEIHAEFPPDGGARFIVTLPVMATELS